MSRYLILPANASHDVHPDNSNNNYKIRLPERLMMKRGEWEIALRAITYPNNWHNVTNAAITLANLNTKMSTKVRVADGKYKNVADLINKCNAALTKLQMNDVLNFKHSTVTGKTSATIHDRFTAFTMSDDLADILGFVPGRTYQASRSGSDIVAANTTNIEGAYDNLYVYCNLCEDRVVGDSNVPCLHNVPARARDGSSNLVHEIVNRPIYVPVANVDTDTVEIDIRRGDGERVLFRGGCVIVTVHLRKAS